MEPTVAEGSVVWVTDEVDSVVTGDVVVLAGSVLPIVHRLVYRSLVGSDPLVYHRGDNGGGIGVASASALRARVVAIMKPERRPIPELADLHADLQRGFRRAGIRCRWHSLGRSLAFRMGLDRVPWIRRLGAKLTSNLLSRYHD